MGQLVKYLVRWIGPGVITSYVALVVLAVLGALVAQGLSWPLPFILGPLILVAIFQIFGGQTGDIGEFRRRVIGVLALYLGSSFSPDLVATMPSWSLSLVIVALLVPLTMIVGFILFRFVFGLDTATAWFSAVPGGLTEMSIFGEAEGGDAQTIATLHTLRVVGMIIFIPFAFSLFLTLDREGLLAGSPGQIERPLTDWFWYVVVIFAFSAAGRRLPIPAGFFTVPMIGACFLYAVGLIQTAPPIWLIIAIQMILGAGLGQRFEFRPLGYWLRSLKLFWAQSLVILALALAGAFFLAPLVPQDFAPLFLAFAPGGLAEMSLIAVAMDQEAVFVTSHHLMRIITALFVGTWLFALIKRFVTVR